MSTSKVITDLYWEPGQGFDPRSASTFSDLSKVRLDPLDSRIKLRLQANFRYPTDANLHVRTPLARPSAVRSLQLIEVDAVLPEGTSLGFKLFDGAVERYWSGAAWTAAGAGNWNTLAEVAAHLPAFPVAARREFAVVLNLKTTDPLVTPEVSRVTVVWEGEVDWVEDVLVDSLTGTMQEDLLLPIELTLPPLPAAVGSVDLDSYRDEAGLTFTAAEAVYDHVADPNHLTNLLSAYNPATRVLTFTSNIPIGGVPFIRLLARVNVSWDTAQDWAELGKLPQVVLRDAETVRSASYPAFADRGVVRADTGVGVSIPAPYRSTFRVAVEVRVNRTREQARLIEALTRFLTVGPSAEVGPFVRSRATDRRFRVQLTEQFSARNPSLDVGDVREFRAEFLLSDVTQQLKPAQTARGVSTFKLSFAAIDSKAEADALAGGAPVPSSSPEIHENL